MAARKTVTNKQATKRTSVGSKIVAVSSLLTNLVMMVYGRSGTGKTHFASTFPKPILFLDINERGTETIASIRGIDVLLCKEWVDFWGDDKTDGAYWFLAEGTKYKTIVIDQVTNLQDMAMREIRRQGNKIEADQFTQRNWGQLGGLLKTAIAAFRGLSDRYNIVFLAHERVFDGGGEEEGANNAIAPTIGARVIPSVGSFLDGAVDAIGSTFIRERMVKDGAKKVRHVDYCMRTGPHASYATKVRRPVTSGPIPDVMVNPTYQKIMDLVSGKSETKPLVRSKKNG